MTRVSFFQSIKCSDNQWLLEKSLHGSCCLVSPLTNTVDGAEQVFWWTHGLGSNQLFDEKNVVLLGEAVCPPLSSLGRSFRPYRLPLYQLNRNAPPGVAAFETLHSRMEEYAEGLKGGFGEKQQAELERQHVAEQRRREEFCALECDLLNAFPPSLAKLVAARMPAPPVKPPNYKMRPQPHGQRPAPIATRASDRQEREDFPNVYQGHCCLDVDLAFLGPPDPKFGLAEGNDGTLAFEIRTLRVPPLDHGFVTVRVCEAVMDGPVCNYNRVEFAADDAGATPNGRVLEQQLFQNMAIEAPVISQTRALWSSPVAMLGSWAGSGCVPACTATWAMRKAGASLWIASQEEMQWVAKHDIRPNVAEEQMKFRKCKCFSIPVTKQWSPIALVSADPLPRSRELFDERVMSNAPSNLPSKLRWGQ